MAYKPIWDMDYVYNADESDEFRQVRITLEISDTDGRVTLTPNFMMTIREIDSVMREYSEDVLKRMLTDYDSFYPVRIIYNGVEMKVEFNSQREVMGIAIV
ncbi:MAG: hypothetical protein FWB88_00350 [Defluviitaleaceae bacterium]|nr:hypothetical protein [Defluviitaleaceae bacterium]MCL2239023.1 hypothetical protein [Defluviitaleaceae bacterium]